jgi:glycolate oxidase iron-sulfur subunit
VLRGCAARAYFPRTEDAAVLLLEAAGYAVRRLSEPPCCGALAAHAGEPDVAERLGGRTVARVGGLEGVLVPTASGCGAHLARGLAGAGRIRVLDLSVALETGPHPLRFRPSSGESVVYQDACHLRHGQGIVDPPRRLLRQAGFELREAAEGELCCGSAGTYNLAEPGLASALGERKAGRLRETGARWAVTANPGCALQLEAHLDRPGDPRVRTWASLLAERLEP